MLDVHLLTEARRLNKTVGSLEAPEIHCEVITNLFFFVLKKIIYLSVLERRLAIQYNHMENDYRSC
jgi:hypothetical protein